MFFDICLNKTHRTIFGYTNKIKYLIDESRSTFEIYIDLLLPEDTKGIIFF